MKIIIESYGVEYSIKDADDICTEEMVEKVIKLIIASGHDAENVHLTMRELSNEYLKDD